MLSFTTMLKRVCTDIKRADIFVKKQVIKQCVYVCVSLCELCHVYTDLYIRDICIQLALCICEFYIYRYGGPIVYALSYIILYKEFEHPRIWFWNQPSMDTE